MKKEEFNDLLKELGINKKKFAEIANTPYPTVANWGAQRSGKINGVPEWVKPFLYYFKKAQKLDYVTREICDKLHEAKSKL